MKIVAVNFGDVLKGKLSYYKVHSAIERLYKRKTLLSKCSASHPHGARHTVNKDPDTLTMGQ